VWFAAASAGVQSWTGQGGCETADGDNRHQQCHRVTGEPLDAAAVKEHSRTKEDCVMAIHWRCLIGRHDWREVETPGGDTFAECTRCGKHDWQRLVRDPSGKWHGEPPAGIS
jgi:hypothetical protein